MVDGPVERSLDVFETGVRGRRAINREGEHGKVVALPKPERGAVSGRTGTEGPGVKRGFLMDRRDWRVWRVAEEGRRVRTRREWRIAS